MAKKVLLLHGWGGSDFPHWQSWLAGELAKGYGCVNFLRFDDVDTPRLKRWSEQTLEALQDFKPDVVICHSLANTLWFHLCHTENLIPVEHLYLVAPPSLTCSIEELGEFFPVTVPQQLFANNTTLITSTNDPYMTSKEADSLEKALNIRHEILQNAGHINADSGYGKWEWMLREIRSL